MSKKISENQTATIIELAKDLYTNSRQTEKSVFGDKLKAITQSPEGKNFLIRLLDVSFRSHNYDRVASYVKALFKKTKNYHSLFSTSEITLIRLFRIVGYQIPRISVPLLLKQIQAVTAPVLFFWGDKTYSEHYAKRKKEDIQLNINLIGEALVGEEEAKERIAMYKSLLNQDDVDYISIKISTIYSQIDSIAHKEVVQQLIPKLSELYQEVIRIEKEKGFAKFINLDMEEYRDLSITIAAFKTTLDLPEFKYLRAGIVLQAYLPDSYRELQKLQKWANKRVAAGGSPIKVRIVKGANLEMELTEASLQDWNLATYNSKLEVDANFKRMLLESIHPDTSPALNIGVASHNIFDLAFALFWVKKYQLESFVDFEMLEGIAGKIPFEIKNQGINVVLYTPIVQQKNYNNAIAYLVRRLDESTQRGNFLREEIDLKVDSTKWRELSDFFEQSIKSIDSLSELPNRNQDRNNEDIAPQETFKNVANTDWTIQNNRLWIEQVKLRWSEPLNIVPKVIPVVAIDVNANRKVVAQNNWEGTLPWTYELATTQDYDTMIESDSIWYSYSPIQKAQMLRQAACEMEKCRGDLIAVAVEELGKTIPEVDVEVSEAIDFANFYAQSLLDIEEDPISYECSGINLVLSPWNFPIAIPIGGVLASLAAGKRVILKPSQNAAACAYMISQCLWNAGIPTTAFAFLPTEEKNLDNYLNRGNFFDAVILTGGTSTAQFLLDRNPQLNLYAETGGKNATIVTALSDRDQAIKHVIHSAFGNTGQKCSATSLLVLEKEVYEDPHFKNLLKDAAQSRIVGHPWDYHTHIGPLALPANKRILHVIENTPDEQWLLKPQLQGDYVMSPGIVWGTTTGDYGFKNELFGPILFVVKANNLKHAVDIVNQSQYGLTSGIESLDQSEIDYWKANIQAGNLYINRSTTGAIVQRQPFGGIKASCYGFGMKAGGVNYVRQFLNVQPQTIVPYDLYQNYHEAYKSHFGIENDYVKIRGQHNICRYLLPKKVLILIDDQTDPIHIDMVKIAAQVLHIRYETCTDWHQAAKQLNFDTVIRNLATNLDEWFRKEAHQKHIHIYERTPHPEGRYELLNYVTEQSISHDYHRYGNRMGEKSV